MFSLGLGRTLRRADESEAALHSQVQTLYGLLDRLGGGSIMESAAPKRDEDFFLLNQDKIDSRVCVANKTEDEALIACSERAIRLRGRMDWIGRIYRSSLERGDVHAK